MVITDRAPFYHYGPAQPQGADFNIFKDTPLTLIRRELGFSEVRTMDGKTGYMQNEDLGPAGDLAAATTPRTQPAPASSSPRSASPSRKKAEPEPVPRFTIPPEEIPLPEAAGTPTVTTQPSRFR